MFYRLHITHGYLRGWGGRYSERRISDTYFYCMCVYVFFICFWPVVNNPFMFRQIRQNITCFSLK